jgi:hydrogenase maturation protein HypF
VTDVRSGVDAGPIGARFHAAVARLVVDAAVAVRESYGLTTVTLGGGVFQNALLLGAAREMLGSQGFCVLWPQQLPPNDGGLALGQLLVAAWPGRAEREEDR